MYRSKATRVILPLTINIVLYPRPAPRIEAEILGPMNCPKPCTLGIRATREPLRSMCEIIADWNTSTNVHRVMKPNRLTTILTALIPLPSIITIRDMAIRETHKGLNRPKRAQKNAITQPTTANMEDHVSTGPIQSWATPSSSAASSM